MRGELELEALEESLRREAERRDSLDTQDELNAPLEPALTDRQAAEYLPTRRMVSGNRFKLLRDGVEAFPEMLDAIRSARRKVRLEVYMFIDDAVGEMFARALMDVAARGVQVKVLYDWMGSLGVRRAFFKRMRDGGVDVRAFKPLSFARGVGALIRRDHRKILVVDGEVAFIGGINIATKWAPKGHGEGWRDDVLRIEGPTAMTLERLFSASWRMEVHKRLGRLRRRHSRRRQLLLRRGESKAVVLSGRRAIHRAYLRAIDHARASVMIANAYFLPDRRLLHALKQAAQRGVRVELIVAGKTDHPWIKWAGRALYSRLLRWGVHVYEWYDGVLHSKTAVVDGTWGTIGSFNLEPMSLRFNYEANVVFTDRRWGKVLERSFLDDACKCRRITPEEWEKRPLWHRAVERFFFFFRKIL